MRSYYKTIITLGIVAIFIILTTLSSQRESLTFDEIFNLQEGRTNLTTQTFPIEPYNPPLIRELATIPQILGFGSEKITPNERAFPSRIVIIFFGTILLLYIIRTTDYYFGGRASAIAGFLFALEPTVLAHSHYITPDMGLTLFVFLSYISFLNLLSSPTVLRFFYFGVMLGLAASSKISALPFLMGSFFVVFIIKSMKYSIGWHWHHFGKAFFSLIVAGFVVWSTFFFRSSPILIKHDDPRRVSNQILVFARDNNLQFLTNQIKNLQGTAVPLGDYIALLKNNALRLKATSEVFFRGKFYSSASPSMIFFTAITKIPLPLLILVLLSCLLHFIPYSIKQGFASKMLRLRIRDQGDKEKDIKEAAENLASYKLKLGVRKNERITHPIYFLIPILVIFSFAVVSRMQPLIRYVLPAFPFLVILAGSSYPVFSTWKKKILLCVFLAWFSIGTLTNFPHFISYTNELVLQSKRYLVYMDSNLDWGQSLITFANYYEKKTPSKLSFSYFGRDNASLYGFISNTPWGSHKNDEICAFHEISNKNFVEKPMTAISVTNWYSCGYYNNPVYSAGKIQDIIGDSILIF